MHGWKDDMRIILLECETSLKMQEIERWLYEWSMKCYDIVWYAWIWVALGGMYDLCYIRVWHALILLHMSDEDNKGMIRHECIILKRHCNEKT